MGKKSLIIILGIAISSMILIIAILLAVVWKSEGKTKCEKAEFGIIYSNADGASKSFYSACFKGKLKEYYCLMGKPKYRLKNCGEGKVCEDGKCVAEQENPGIIPCVSDGECEENEICYQGKCEILAPCDENEDCQKNEVCIQNICRIGIRNETQNISVEKNPLYDLELFGDGWPRVIYDRSFSEYFLRWGVNFNRGQPFTEKNYQAFSSRLLSLDGVTGKVFDEEVPDTFNDKGVEYFSEFKKKNPNKTVLLHFDGDCRDPRFGGGNFSAGHWLYKPGCSVTQDIPESSEDTWIYVENPNLFSMNIGGRNEVANISINCYNNHIANCSVNDEIVICSKINNVMDWDYCEQVVLLDKDMQNKRLLVRRNVFDFSPPKSFRANEAYVTAHLTRGPGWGGNSESNQMWRYNFATTCPKDKNGKTASDVLAEEFGNYFKKGGLLEYFDGVMFDIVSFTASGSCDIDNNGIIDNGIIGGVNVYAIGASDFSKKLRALIGENKMIIPDTGSYGGGYPQSYIGSAQRTMNVLNGAEIEAWPPGQSSVFWSSAINEVLFWNLNNAGRPFMIETHLRDVDIPRINPAEDGRRTMRWSLGAIVITDSFWLFGKKAGEPSDRYPFAEFFRNGNANWLGRPVGKIVRLAEKSVPTLKQSDSNFISKFSSDNALLSLEANKIKISPRGSVSNVDQGIILSLKNIAVSGSDLVVYFNVSAEQWTGYPADIPRVVFVMVDGKLRNGKPLALETFANDKSFLAGFYFRDITSDSVNLTIAIEGNSSFYISDFRAYNAVDALAREYDNGAVLVNPSDEPYTFRLCEIFPNSCDKFETREIVVPGIDAAFLEKKR